MPDATTGTSGIVGVPNCKLLSLKFKYLRPARFE